MPREFAVCARLNQALLIKPYTFCDIVAWGQTCPRYQRRAAGRRST